MKKKNVKTSFRIAACSLFGNNDFDGGARVWPFAWRICRGLVRAAMGRRIKRSHQKRV